MKRNAFTLAELIAVIVLLAIILAITVPSISSIIYESRKKAFESDAKLVLKAIDNEKLLNMALDVTSINDQNLNDLLGLSNQNYVSVKVIVDNDVPIINIIGKDKWEGLIACGTYREMVVAETFLECKNDMVPPIITLLGDDPYNIYVGQTYDDPGATAFDNYSGDITANIVVTSSVNTSREGTYYVYYSVSDAAGNEVSATRTINVIDNVKPIITFNPNGNNVYTMNQSVKVIVSDEHGDIDLDSLRYVWKNNTTEPLEGDFITGFTNGEQIMTPSSVTGDYYLWATAQDKSGNRVTAKTNAFKLDNEKPVITLLGNNPVTVNKGTSYVDAGATAFDNIDGNITVTVIGTVNINIVGTYYINYSAVDSSGNQSTTVMRTVNVVDSLAPVITILGNNPISIDAGTVYSDAGATAVDDVDGDVTNRIVTTGTVNPSVGGVYTITYTVVDNAGNQAVATRTVNVYTTWYRSRTVTSATYYGNYSASSSTSYYCPSGYTSSGSGSTMTCSITTIETANNIATTTYSCPSGYTSSGSGSTMTCTKTTTVAASSTAANETRTCSSGTYVASVDKCRIYTSERVYSCPSGYSLSGTTCTKSTSATITGCKTWNAWTRVSDQCVGGYTGCATGVTFGPNGGAGYQSKVECCGPNVGTTYERYCGAYSYSCSSGTLSGSSCITTTSASVSCPSGWTMSAADNCYQNVATPTTTYSCSSGTLSGTTCYSCSSGTLSGTNCVTTTTATRIATTSYSCPSGYTSSGSGSTMTCTKTVTNYTSNLSSTSYYCPSGGTLSGTTCYRSYYSCSSGTLSGSTCYGSWSVWSKTPVTASSTLEVETEKRLVP